MNETQNPRDAHPGGLHNDGDQHVTASVPPKAPCVARLRDELARRDAAVAIIRQQLQEQPSAHAVRACARRWSLLIGQIADDIAEGRN
jgi:hypothetical protein